MKAVFLGLCLFIGVTFSAIVSEKEFACLRGKGFSFAIIKCLDNTAFMDPNCMSNIANAQAAGLTAHIYACGRLRWSQSGGRQIGNVISYLNQSNIEYHALWIKADQCTSWDVVGSNRGFLEGMIMTANYSGVPFGIASNESEWKHLMGHPFTYASAYPLWYAQYISSFGNFTAFGGWAAPAMKQYLNDQYVCDVNVNLNWMPSGSAAIGATSQSTSSYNSANSAGSNSGSAAGQSYIYEQMGGGKYEDFKGGDANKL